MREGILSLGALAASDVSDRVSRAEPLPKIAVVRRTQSWDAEEFASRQIRGLVRQVFLGDVQRQVRQVAISAIERETDVQCICGQIADVLAQETSARIALAASSADLQGLDLGPAAPRQDSAVPLQRFANRVGANVWQLPSACAAGITSASLHSYLSQIRKQFDYSIIELPLIGESQQGYAMAEFADGLILVVSAQNTRRATARKVIEALACTRARILGTVLCDRVFPIPEAIYRRL